MGEDRRLRILQGVQLLSVVAVCLEHRFEAGR